MVAPDGGENDGHVGMIENAMKGGGNVVCHLKDVFEWVGDAKVPEPDEIAHESCAIEDGRVFVIVDPWFGDEGIRVTCIGFGYACGRINAETGFRIAPAIGYSKDAKEEAGEKAPEKARKNKMIRKFFLRSDLFVHSGGILGEVLGQRGHIALSSAGVT